MSPVSEPQFAQSHPNDSHTTLARRFSFPTFSGTTPHESLYIVVIAAAGALLLFVLIAVYCCCRRRRKKKKQALMVRSSVLFNATNIIKAKQGEHDSQVYERNAAKEQEEQEREREMEIEMKRELKKETEAPEQRKSAGRFGSGYGSARGRVEVEVLVYQGQQRRITQPSPPPFASYNTPARSEPISPLPKAAIRPDLVMRHSGSPVQGVPTSRPRVVEPASPASAYTHQSAVFEMQQRQAPVNFGDYEIAEPEPPTPTSMFSAPSIYSSAPPTPVDFDPSSAFGFTQSSRASVTSGKHASLAPSTGRRASSKRASRSSRASRAPYIAQQSFTPASGRPEELSVSQGERLAVLQTFADGWFLVARSGGGGGVRRSLLNAIFPMPDSDPNAVSNAPPGPQPQEARYGFVPEWVFLRSAKGLRAERPERVESASEAAFEALRRAEDPGHATLRVTAAV
ncbi:hypothetical protein CONPUDRAFT_88391 [Coniophora puteana RWD-64-598 SS2]|uniref:SH3 domain-containing protein n=1 Tax=Coniophora puteana (strain RWD-64-598) TaxID=741705 RepID=A0A5M3MY57_CONPW|nr:uncharacterized protein CONPUDRAFT_88391 [Coniophora puteana RWD-64-598 SS2]EIW84050.1 hypothetical protein CONPUDRAFT_88391 [Coniophora puteana RWD-64-598 SS2]